MKAAVFLSEQDLLTITDSLIILRDVNCRQVVALGTMLENLNICAGKCESDCNLTQCANYGKPADDLAFLGMINYNRKLAGQLDEKILSISLLVEKMRTVKETFNFLEKSKNGF